jgi:hypothetical protein
MRKYSAALTLIGTAWLAQAVPHAARAESQLASTDGEQASAAARVDFRIVIPPFLAAYSLPLEPALVLTTNHNALPRQTSAMRTVATAPFGRALSETSACVRASLDARFTCTASAP